MSDEIKARFSLTVENGSHKENYPLGQLAIDQAAKGAGGGVQTIGTGDEAVDLGSELSTEGVLLLINLDSTNFVTYGPQIGTGVIEVFGRIKAGEFAFLRLEPGVTIMAQADTAAVQLFSRCFED